MNKCDCLLVLNTHCNLNGNGSYFILYLPNSLALNCQSFHLGEIVVKCNNICDYGLLIWILSEHICKQDSTKMFVHIHNRRMVILCYGLTVRRCDLPSGSNNLVTPSFFSATLKACCRLCVGFDLFRLP